METIKALLRGHKHKEDQGYVISIEDVDCSIAYHGLVDMDAEVDLITNWWTLNAGDFEKYDVCVSGVNDCLWALHKMGVSDFHIPCYPESMKIFLERNIEVMPLKDLIKNIGYYGSHGNRFVKPVRPKLFRAFITSDENGLNQLYNIEPDTMVYVSDIVDFRSEWRVYVKLNKIEKICHYSGNPLSFPNINVVNAMIQSWAGPSCYALDVGIIGSVTALVEINDFYSIGNYGLGPKEYVEMLMLRWSQLTNRRQFSKAVKI